MLGPAHWNVAYVQPSRRPDDGRFGENPNRLFKHHQFQVILKPSPDEVQDLYLQSLEACGINPRQHDIRFEEDNWESPTLGAWGIGWQVLFDGLEITQFTYFQQVGGIDLAPIACEITYGLERIAMALQKVDNVYDLDWAPGVTYREVRLREEIEQSKYVFGQVDGVSGEEFAAHHRDLFERHYGVLPEAAGLGPGAGRRWRNASSARTCSTSSTAAAASASPSGRPTSCGCGSWRCRLPRRITRARSRSRKWSRRDAAHNHEGTKARRRR